MIFTDKTCQRCNCTYMPTGRNSKFCEPCKVIHRREKAAIDQQAYRVRNMLIKNPGVGSGGSQKKGTESPYYKHGLGCDFQDVRKQIKDEVRYCEKCNKDLLEVSRYHWCLHHIDHDRTNNVRSNFQLLCKRCHQMEHDCHKAFGTRRD